MSTHIIRAKLMHDKRTYRDIEIRSDKTLYHLAEAIVDAFDFDMDHAFGFYSDLGWDYHRSLVRYELFADMGVSDDWGDFGGRPKAKGVKRTRLAGVFTEPKQKFSSCSTMATIGASKSKSEVSAKGKKGRPILVSSPRKGRRRNSTRTGRMTRKSKRGTRGGSRIDRILRAPPSRQWITCPVQRSRLAQNGHCGQVCPS